MVAELPIIIALAGLHKAIGGVADTEKVAWQVVVNGAQLLVLVKVTVLLPPEASGAPVLSFVSTILPQPPLAFAVANQVENAELIAACVCPKASILLVGQLSITVGAGGIVKVAEQVKGAAQPDE
jgi:hypothetical protein